MQTFLSLKIELKPIPLLIKKLLEIILCDLMPFFNIKFKTNSMVLQHRRVGESSKPLCQLLQLVLKHRTL